MISQEYIIIRGLRQNNLKNVSLDIPKGKIVVFTGVSGSGKSMGGWDKNEQTGFNRNSEGDNGVYRRFY